MPSHSNACRLMACRSVPTVRFETHLPFFECMCVHLCACALRIFSFTVFCLCTYPCTFPHSLSIWCIVLAACLNPRCPDLLSAWVSFLVLCGYKRQTSQRIRHHSSTTLRTVNNSATATSQLNSNTTNSKCARTRTSSTTT